MALFELKRLGLIAPTSRGFYKITRKGLTFLKKSLSEQRKLLFGSSNHPESQTSSKATSHWTVSSSNSSSNKINQEQTEKPISIESGEQLVPPSDIDDRFFLHRKLKKRITEKYQQLRINLAQQLRVQILNSSPSFFESLVVDLLKKMGYGCGDKFGWVVGHSGDEGIDGIIFEDRLGIEVLYIQAKRWSSTIVGRPEIQKFVGALQGKRAEKGIFITTSAFSREAEEYVKHLDRKVVLVDGNELVELMIEYNVGVETSKIYPIKDINFNYFTEK
ncbi:MAG: restriction endonuclease [Candidatus Heimdallarchaeota archaeon]|nr:restriction endonuclease [Candidatus Heimdallarchaeota archaeon]